jgi:hypothetical protein
MKRAVFGFLLFFLPGFLVAQSTNATLNEDNYHWLSRYEIKAGRIAPEWFTGVKPVIQLRLFPERQLGMESGYVQ